LHVNFSNILRIVLATLLAAAMIAALAVVPPRQYLALLDWIAGLGWRGMLILVGLYAAVCLVFLPGALVTLAAGFLYGAILGGALASLGAVLGGTAAFLVARLIFRQWLNRSLADHPRFSAIDRAVGKQGFKIVLLTRLCSLFPYDLMSYVFGMTPVSLGRYVLATWLGRLPGIAVSAYLGAATRAARGSLADLASGRIPATSATQVLLILSLLAMAATVIVIGRIARQAVKDCGL
jgi:uncharacterized membrane protein YdjX (TVP38/TMEM64 family)